MYVLTVEMRLPATDGSVGTSELKGYTFHCNGYNVNLVDRYDKNPVTFSCQPAYVLVSPGFNDTYKSETEVLQDIATWLQETYERDSRSLTGIIYLHSINHPRMEGSALRNLKMFRELCGPDPLKNVMLVTTFWGEVDHTVAEARERELATTPEFWGSMIRRGSRIARFTDAESAVDIVSSLLGSVPEPLKIQRELVEDEKQLIDTGAGQVVSEELTKLERKHQAEKLQMQRDMQEALEE